MGYSTRALRVATTAAITLALCPQASAATQRARPLSHGVDPANAALRHHTRVATAAGDGWCGVERSSADLADQVDNGRYRYHAVYLMASDVTDRFRSVASQIQADALGASALLEQLYGRALRFDMGTNCGPGSMDISAVRTPLTSADFQSASTKMNGTLRLVASALSAAGFPTLKSGGSKRYAASLTTNYVVWLDAPADPNGCGTAQVYDDPSRTRTNWNNYGGKVAVLFRSGDSFCGAAAVRHEIGHTLGALQPEAPHAFDGRHCDDAYEDTMCYSNAPVQGNGEFENQFFDYGNDDYWDPPGGQPLAWWTVDLSRFICATATCNLTADGGA